MAKKLKKIAAQVPTTDAEVEKLLSDTLTAQLEREALVTAQDAALKAAKEQIEAEHHYDRDISSRDVTIARNVELLELWATIHRKRFGAAKSMTIGGIARLGWRLGNWKTALRKSVKWDDVVAFLKSLKDRGAKEDASDKAKARAELANQYLRVKTDANKDNMLRDRAERASRALLKAAGVTFEQDETFFIEPDREGQQPATLKAP